MSHLQDGSDAAAFLIHLQRAAERLNAALLKLWLCASAAARHSQHQSQGQHQQQPACTGVGGLGLTCGLAGPQAALQSPRLLHSNQ